MVHVLNSVVVVDVVAAAAAVAAVAAAVAGATKYIKVSKYQTCVNDQGMLLLYLYNYYFFTALTVSYFL